MVAAHHFTPVLRGNAGRGQASGTVPRFDRRQLVHAAALTAQPPNRMYAELHCHSAYSFLDGASPPDELLAEAHRLGLPALALTDRNGIYGSLAFAHAAQRSEEHTSELQSR